MDGWLFPLPVVFPLAASVPAHNKRYGLLIRDVWTPFFFCYLTSSDIFPKYVALSYTLTPRYKRAGRGFDSRLCLCNFSLTYTFRPHHGPGVDSTFNINEYQECFLGGKGGRCVGLTTLLPSCADCLEIWEPQTPGILRACPGL